MTGVMPMAVAALWCAGAIVCEAASPPVKTTVVLPEPAMTSAGVYDTNQRLVRTLWSGRRLPAGALDIAWDGRDDEGSPVSPAAGYVARVLTHDVRAVWEGVIGNTSKDNAGSRLHRAFGPVHDMAIDAQGNAFYVVGYNEQQPALHQFHLADPQRQTSLAHDDYLRVFRYAATDGTLAYFANVGGEREPESFVIALEVKGGAEHRFAQGRLIMPGQNVGNRWSSVIDHERLPGEGASGLAVQRQGDILFVAHRNANEVRLFHKHSGAPVGRIPVTAPDDMEVAPDDSVWVLSASDGQPVVLRYQLQNGDWIRVGRIAEGLVRPVAIGVSPRDGVVVVADADSEQLKAFNADGTPAWGQGQPGGYRHAGPDVTAGKLWLSAGPTYVTFAADGSFWVGDTGNVRNLHYSPQRRYLGQIMYLPASYVATVDPASPVRVFRHFLEFSVDYAKPLRDSWMLVRNWGAGLDRRYFGKFDGFESVVTLANRRTYGVVRHPGTRIREIVELAAGGLRATGEQLDDTEKLYPDGSRRFHRQRLRSLAVYARTLERFDEDGNPQWGSPVEIAGVARLTARDPYYHEVPAVQAVNAATYPDAGATLIVSFNPGRSEGFHLGGLTRGQDGWQWRASPTGPWETDKEGLIATRDGRYETGNGVQYPGNIVMASGRHIIAGYHGEAWNGGQANQWLHFLDNGLFVGQFGRPVYPAANRNQALPEAAGNAFSPQLVTVNDELYLWHNDEGVHGGLHRWHIEGTDSIAVLSVPILGGHRLSLQ